MTPRFALPRLIFTTGLVSLVSVAHAERATEDPPVSPDAAAAAPADKAPGFLGVGVAESLAPPDAGPDLPRVVLLVSDIMPGSPAEVAGLRTGDLLLEIDGQQLLHPVQLSRLVSMQPVGQDVELAVLRRGVPQTLTATLGKRPADLAAPAAGGQLGQADALRPPFGEFEQVPRELGPDFAPPALHDDLQQMRERMDRQFEQMRQMFRQGMNDGWPGGEMWERADPIDLDFNFEGIPLGQQVTVLQDQDHKITVTQTQDGRHLLATDPHGRVLFDGPIDTPAQLNAVPKTLRDKLPAPGASGPMNLRLFRQLDPEGLFDRLNPGAQPPTKNDEPGEELPLPAGRAV